MVFTHPLEDLRRHLYGVTSGNMNAITSYTDEKKEKVPPVLPPVLVPKHRDRIAESLKGTKYLNLKNPVNSVHTLYRRQFLTERSAQIQASYQQEKTQHEMKKLELLADMGSSKKIWLKWVESLATKIEAVYLQINSF